MLKTTIFCKIDQKKTLFEPTFSKRDITLRDFYFGGLWCGIWYFFVLKVLEIVSGHSKKKFRSISSVFEKFLLGKHPKNGQNRVKTPF